MITRARGTPRRSRARESRIPRTRARKRNERIFPAANARDGGEDAQKTPTDGGVASAAEGSRYKRATNVLTFMAKGQPMAAISLALRALARTPPVHRDVASEDPLVRSFTPLRISRRFADYRLPIIEYRDGAHAVGSVRPESLRAEPLPDPRTTLVQSRERACPSDANPHHHHPVVPWKKREGDAIPLLTRPLDPPPLFSLLLESGDCRSGGKA